MTPEMQVSEIILELGKATRGSMLTASGASASVAGLQTLVLLIALALA